MKYTLRKLGFLVVLAALIATPFAVQKYKSLTTTDPYILMAREIESFERSDVDVLFIEKNPNPEFENRVAVFTYIEEYPSWSVRKDQVNFNQFVLQTIAKRDFEAVDIIIGWDFPPNPPSAYRVQGLWTCPELRRSSCVWEQVPSIQLKSAYTVWAGMGKP